MASNHDLRVKLASFEGPLDLLLYLIRQNEIDIQNIRIAEITDQYLRTINLMREYDLDIAGEFILMAATLILIKSRKLLPESELKDVINEDGETIQTEEELMRRLLEHQRFQEVARELRDRPLSGFDFFKRPELEEKEAVAVGDALKEMSITELSLALQKILLRARRPVRRVQRETVSVSTAIRWIFDKISTDEATELDSLFPESYGRSEIVAVFLAILELGRLKKIRVLQHVIYGTIYLVARENLDSQELDQLLKSGDTSYAYKAAEASP